MTSSLSACASEMIVETIDMSSTETAQVALQDIVVDAGLQRFHRGLLAHRPGDEDERQVGVARFHEMQRFHGAERRHLVVRDNHVPAAEVQGGFQRARRVDPLGLDGSEPLSHLAGNEIGVARRIFDHQDLQRPFRHGAIVCYASLPCHNGRLAMQSGSPSPDTFRSSFGRVFIPSSGGTFLAEAA